MQDKNKLLIIDFATRVGEVSEILAKNLLSIDGIAKDIPGFSSVMALGNIMITIKVDYGKWFWGCLKIGESTRKIIT